MAGGFKYELTPEKQRSLLEAIAQQGTLSTILSRLDVGLGTRASEATLGTRLADAVFTGRWDGGIGFDGTAARRLRTNIDGNLQVGVLTLPITRGDWLSIIPNPSLLDVLLSSRLAGADFNARWDGGVFGWDGTAARRIRTDTGGILQTSATLAITRGDWLSIIPNPSMLDVLLSSRLAEVTFTGRHGATTDPASGVNAGGTLLSQIRELTRVVQHIPVPKPLTAGWSASKFLCDEYSQVSVAKMGISEPWHDAAAVTTTATAYTPLKSYTWNCRFVNLHLANVLTSVNFRTTGAATAWVRVLWDGDVVAEWSTTSTTTVTQTVIFPWVNIKVPSHTLAIQARTTAGTIATEVGVSFMELNSIQDIDLPTWHNFQLVVPGTTSVTFRQMIGCSMCEAVNNTNQAVWINFDAPATTSGPSIRIPDGMQRAFKKGFRSISLIAVAAATGNVELLSMA